MGVALAYAPLMIVLAVLPLLLALAAAFGWRIPGSPAEFRDKLPAPLAIALLPALALGWRGLDVALLDAPLAFGAALLVGVLITFVLARTLIDTTRLGWFVGLLAACVTYSWGLVAQADVMLDRSLPQFQAVVVTGKSQSRHHNYIDVSQDGQTGLPGRVDVERAFFDRVSVKERICFRVYPGALRIRWHEIGFCAARFMPDHRTWAEPAP